MVKRKAAIYVRVSTLDQVRDGYSLDSQERVLKEWCNKNRYAVYKVYADRGISGKNMSHRPALIEMLNDARDGHFDLITFWALSRFTRSVSDLYDTMERLQKWNVELYSYTEAFDTSTPMGRAMVGIIGVFAQLERELTSERVIAAITERARQGKRICNEALGYDSDGKDTFKINQQEAEYVRFCFDQYAVRKSLVEVAELAKEKGYRGKHGKLPSAYSVYTILTRPLYCGYNMLHGVVYKGTHPQIISVNKFIHVQNLLIRQGKNVGRKRQNHTIQDVVHQIRILEKTISSQSSLTATNPDII